jgi:ADP-ribose pyrophosphatase
MPIKPFERQSSEMLLETPIFKLRRDRSVNPRSGHAGAYYVLESPDWVNMIALTDGGQLILVRQFRHGSAQLELELPAGLVEAGEAPEAAAARELLEETGHRAGRVSVLGHVDPNPAYQQNRCYHILLEDCQKVAEPDLDAGEDIDIELVSPSSLPAMLERGQLRSACGIGALFFWLSRAGKLQW